MKYRNEARAIAESLNKSFYHHGYPVGHLDLIADLVYLDGPFLSHYTDALGNNYLFYWVDADNTHNRWLIFKVDPQQITRYTEGELSLLTLLQSAQGAIYAVDANNDGEYSNISSVSLPDLPDSYLPMPDAYHDEHYAEIYQG